MRASQPRGAAAAIRIVVLMALFVGMGGRVYAEPAVVVDSDQFGNVFQLREPAELTVRVTADPDQDLAGRVHVAAHDAYGESAGRLTFRVRVPAGGSAARGLPRRYRPPGYGPRPREPE